MKNLEKVTYRHQQAKHHVGMYQQQKTTFWLA